MVPLILWFCDPELAPNLVLFLPQTSPWWNIFDFPSFILNSSISLNFICSPLQANTYVKWWLLAWAFDSGPHLASWARLSTLVGSPATASHCLKFKSHHVSWSLEHFLGSQERESKTHSLLSRASQSLLPWFFFLLFIKFLFLLSFSIFIPFLSFSLSFSFLSLSFLNLFFFPLLPSFLFPFLSSILSFFSFPCFPFCSLSFLFLWLQWLRAFLIDFLGGGQGCVVQMRKAGP